MSEFQLQARCFQWHWNNFPGERRMLYHIQGKARNRIEGNKFKAMGVVKGIADFALITNSNGTIYIEMKTDEGRLSREQEDFRDKLTKKGGIYIICRSLEHFQEIIRNFTENK